MTRIAPGRVVLLTNIWLESRAGSETIIRDLALGLLRRGYRPVVYSPALGEAAREIATRGVPVIDDLRLLAETPDIIHAHHSIPCGEALIRFPQVPALLVCHSFSHWVEAPVHFPQIAVFGAVDEACHDRLAHMEGIAPERVMLLPNAVDLSRIPKRPLPLRNPPLRAAAFGKTAGVPEIETACARAGLEFANLGWMGGGVSLPNPEQELVNFDIVFATARSALEALCCGCAVIVCDQRGMAGLVTAGNFDTFRARNFGLRSLAHAVSVDRLVDEIARYDPVDAAKVADKARNEADFERLLDLIENLYVEILSGSRRPNITEEAHAQAVARFLHENLPRRPRDPRWPWLGLREQLKDEIRSLQIGTARAEEARHELKLEIAALKRSRLLRLGRWLRRIANRPA